MSSNTQEYTERLQHWARISFSPQQHNSVAQSRLVKHLAPAFFFYFVSRWLFAALQPASASRCLFAMAPTASILLIGAPASHKPHSAEKSTPVWLALWRIWAGFANSQLRCANFPALIFIYMRPSPLLPPWSRCSDRRKSFGPSAPIAYATSVSPPNEAVAWPWAQVFGVG